MANSAYDLFLSYNRADGDVVAALALALRHSGVRVWLDRWELIPGQNFPDLERVIPSCEAIAICVGRHGAGAFLRGERGELSLAVHHHLRCIPILLPNAREIPAELSQFQAIDLRSDRDDQTAALQELVQSLTKQGPPKDAAAAPSEPSSPSAITRFLSLFRPSRQPAGAANPNDVASPAAQPPAAPAPATPEIPSAGAKSPGDGKQDLETARNILRGQSAGLQEIVDLAKRLRNQKHFGYARQLLERVRANAAAVPPAMRLYLGQQHALCTYKDPHLPADLRYDQALRILGDVEDLRTTSNQETLGLAGAVCKYKWEAFGQNADLDRSAGFYQRGYEAGVRNDLGYTAINAAFVLDLLAFQEAEQSANSGNIAATAQQRRERARAIRMEVVATLAPLVESSAELRADWWFLVTVAEAYFGLGEYEKAQAWVLRARELQPADWQLESFLRQLASVARLRAADDPVAAADLEGTAGWKVLAAIAGPEKSAGIRTALIGKVGLGLSGGGFRAALYHIGVLAKLAELDVLRHVEVISCVSGGSIVGAHYYLELQQLLENKPDVDITREDYIAIVRRIQAAFLAGVQTNIRTRVIANLWVNLKMIFWPGYSRTERVGELYEKKIFSRAADGRRQRSMSDLLIHPKGEPETFTPATHNWRRRAKAPVLVLNATTLNTGHSWQFTATWMGEPPAGIDSEVDGNYRLRRMYYSEAPEPYRKYSLGQAVAASACVPGLFEPINLPKVFPDITVRLVDGGVHDNQGIGALLDEACSILLVSDGSGQMDAQNRPGNGVFSTLARSNSILQARVREAEYREVAARRRSSLLRGLMFIHLKKGLDVSPVDWINCEDPEEVSARRDPLTPYGVRKDVQEHISAIRTDLDSFNEVEAYALMTSGYRMAEYEFTRSIRGFPRTAPVSIDWPFLKVEPPMKRVAGIDPAYRDLMQLLAAANFQAFKIWRLSRALRWMGWLLIGAAIAVLLAAAFWGPERQLLTLRGLVVAAIVAVAGSIFGKSVIRVVRWRDTATQIVLGLALCVAGSIAGGLHLWIFDKMYLRRGRIDGLLRRMGPG